jgi:hypothetical protein
MLSSSFGFSAVPSFFKEYPLRRIKFRLPWSNFYLGFRLFFGQILREAMHIQPEAASAAVRIYWLEVV